MRIESKFKGAAIVIFIVMMLIAAVPYHVLSSSRSLLLQISESQQQVESLSRLLALMQDAETGQRGFVITGKENFLEPYYSAIAEFPLLQRGLEQEALASGAARKPLDEIFRVARLKLAGLARTIEIRRTQGFAKAEPIVSSGQGKQLMDTLRELIGAQLQGEMERRDNLRIQFEHESTQAFYLGLGATVLNLLLLGVLLAYMFRVLKERQAAGAALHQAAAQLQHSVTEVQYRNAQMTIAAEMIQALGSTSSVSETFRIIGIYCAKLMPVSSGTLYLFRNSRDLLEMQTSWGQPQAIAPRIGLQDCWALRRGQPHYSGGAHDLCCAHYQDHAGTPHERVCIPLVSQGEMLGLIYLEGAPGEDFAQDEQRNTAVRLAEQIALALTNVKLRETLTLQSIIDPLTGLFNRRYMDETLVRELVRAERKSMPLSLIVLDLDHFKRVNDTFGHDGGDALLKGVAGVIRKNIRESDLACRFGGEELVLILPECDKQAALGRAEKIRSAIQSLDVHHGGRALGNPSASLGVAAFPEDGGGAEALLRAADQALYQAKHAGRNRVVAAG